ncbi:protein nlrc3, partial [Chrysochromulina tobinii]
MQRPPRCSLRSPSRRVSHSAASGAVVTGALTSVDLRGNQLGDEGWGAIFAAICGNKDSKIISNQLCGLDYCGRGTYTAEGITAIADAMLVNGSLMVTNLLGNQLDAEAAKMLAEVAKQKGISLCGIQRDQTTADFRNKGLKLSDAILLASDLSQAVVTGALTSVNLRGNKLRDEGWGAIFAAICGNKDSKIMSLDASSETIGPAGVKLIAEALRTSVTGGLTSIDVRQNNIAGNGAVQLAAAVLGNLKIEIFNEIPIKEMRANSLTELDLNGKYVGVEAGMVVAGLIPVMGALTSLELRGNRLGDEGWGAIFAAICGNKD